jgi:peptide deformylase
MAILPILTLPDKRLKQKSLPVEKVDATIQQLMDDMLATMYAANGIGLAAPQVGVFKQVIVVDVSDEESKKSHPPLALANPKIIRMEGTLPWREGCLSVPDHIAEVVRAAAIEILALDRHNQAVRVEATELLAVCLQHEIDHLHGTLFIDHISALKRSIIMQKLKKKAGEGKEK